MQPVQITKEQCYEAYKYTLSEEIKLNRRLQSLNFTSGEMQRTQARFIQIATLSD
jgi:hypothetical protein